MIFGFYLTSLQQDSGKLGEEQLQLIHYTKQLVTETNAHVKQLNQLAGDTGSDSERKQRRMQKDRSVLSVQTQLCISLNTNISLNYTPRVYLTRI